MSSTQLYTGDPARLAAARASASPSPAVRAHQPACAAMDTGGERQPGIGPAGACASRSPGAHITTTGSPPRCRFSSWRLRPRIDVRKAAHVVDEFVQRATRLESPPNLAATNVEAKERVTRLARRWLLGYFGQEASPLGRFVLFARVCVRRALACSACKRSRAALYSLPRRTRSWMVKNTGVHATAGSAAKRPAGYGLTLLAGVALSRRAACQECEGAILTMLFLRGRRGQPEAAPGRGFAGPGLELWII